MIVRLLPAILLLLMAASVSAADSAIDRVQLEGDAWNAWEQGTAAPFLRGVVEAAGLTATAGPPADVAVELVIGQPGSSLLPAEDIFAVRACAWAEDAADADRFRVQPPDLAVGTYRAAFRARVGAGPWVYGDLDGSANGLQAAQCFTLEVLEPIPTFTPTPSPTPAPLSADNQIYSPEPEGPLSLDGVLLTFSPEPGEAFGYGVCRRSEPALTMQPADGDTTVSLTEDGSREVALPFAFPFYGASFGRVWLNNNGNLTFNGPDGSFAPTPGNHLAQPRVAVLFTDLAPGAVVMNLSQDRAVFTWPRNAFATAEGFATLQAVLRADGTITVQTVETPSIPATALVGLSAGLPVPANPAVLAQAVSCAGAATPTATPGPSPTVTPSPTPPPFGLVAGNQLFAAGFTGQAPPGAGLMMNFSRVPGDDTRYRFCQRPMGELPATSVDEEHTLAIGDDGSAQVALPWPFPFYNGTFAAVWVNNNGSITFEAEDPGYTPTAFEHLSLSRIAALRTDLDTGGRVWWRQDGDRVVFTWQEVPFFDLPTQTATVQVTLHRDGGITIHNPKPEAIPQAATVGLSAGHPSPADLTDFAAGPLCESPTPVPSPAPTPTPMPTFRPSVDDDRDGLTNAQEAGLGTSPLLRDSDGDGIEDGVEVALGSSPLDAQSPAVRFDRDGDGVPDALDPFPDSADGDGDGYGDAWEILSGSDPGDAESHPALGDADGDGQADFTDAVAIFNIFLGNISPTPFADQEFLDVDRSGAVDSVDGVILFNWYLRNIPTIPFR